MEPQSVCLICGEALETLEARCVQCETPAHVNCFNYQGGCAVYSCGSRSYLTDHGTKVTIEELVTQTQPTIQKEPTLESVDFWAQVDSTYQEVRKDWPDIRVTPWPECSLDRYIIRRLDIQSDDQKSMIRDYVEKRSDLENKLKNLTNEIHYGSMPAPWVSGGIYGVFGLILSFIVLSLSR